MRRSRNCCSRANGFRWIFKSSAFHFAPRKVMGVREAPRLTPRPPAAANGI
jgi:hypothetical protein